MEPEGSLPRSQVPSNGPYPGPDPSNPISLRSILLLSTHLRIGLPSGLFPSGFPTNFYMHSASPHYPAHVILMLFILAEECEFMKLLIMQFIHDA
jgi:hypothetical protein